MRWARGPLRFFIGRLTPGQLGLELTTLLAIAAVGSFAFLGYWILIAQGNASGLDSPANGWAVDIAQPTLIDVAKVLTTFGAPWLMEPLCAVVAIVLLLRRRALEAAVIGIGMGMTVALVQIAKHSTDRARPGNGLVDAAGLGLSVGPRGLRDGVDRAGGRRASASSPRSGAAGGSWSPRRCSPRSSG